MIRKIPRLSKSQWKLLSSALSHMGQALMLFSAAAFFFPETVGLQNNFSKITALLSFLYGLLLLVLAVILTKEENE